MTTIKIGIGLLIAIALSACDPAKMLTFENKTKHSIEIIVEFETDDCNILKPLMDAKNFKNVKLGTEEENKGETFYFGIGTWSKQEANALLECTESIFLLENGKRTREIKGEELKKMLTIEVKGVFNHYIIMTVL
jgi:hypothetical protein